MKDFPPLQIEFQKVEKNTFKALLHPEAVSSLEDIGFLDRGFWDQYSPLHKRGELLVIPLKEDLKGVLKIYRRGGLLGRLIKNLTLDGSRSFRELSFYNFLHQSGFPTPKACGAMALRKFGIFYRHLLITEYWENSMDLVAYYKQNPSAFLLEKREILIQLGHLVWRLHELGVYHRDLNLKNILISPSSLEMGIIDFDGARHYPFLPERKRWENLIRLYRSALKLCTKGEFCEISTRDRWRFFLSYWQGDREPRKGAREFWKRTLLFPLRRLFW